MTSFSEKIFSEYFFVKIDVMIPVIYDFNMRRFFSTMNYITHCTYLTRKYVDDDFIEGVHNFLLYSFLSTFDKPCSGVSTILIID